jgi:hypothetical protein
LLVPAVEQWIGTDEERTSTQLFEGCEGDVDLIFSAGF